MIRQKTRAKLHSILDELLDELDGVAPPSANDAAAEPSPEPERPKPPRKARPITELDKARVRANLRRLGVNL